MEENQELTRGMEDAESSEGYVDKRLARVPTYEITINKHALDKEWEGLSYEYLSRADDLNVAEHVVDQCKAKLELTFHKTEMMVRDDPRSYSLSRISDKTVESVTAVQPQVVKARKDLIEAMFESRRLKNVVKALEMKKSALENITKLYLNQYYATEE